MEHYDYSRILLVGDVHANVSFAIRVIDHAAAIGADLIIQLGDLGFGFDDGGTPWLTKIERRLARTSLPLWFVGGNHEHWGRLAQIPVSDDGRRQVSEHIWHLPTGWRGTIGGHRWLAIGGAVSVDRTMRREGHDWWPTEVPTAAEMAGVRAAGRADVVVAHEAPLVDGWLSRRLRQDLQPWSRESPWPLGVLVDIDAWQSTLTHLMKTVQPHCWYHGHHHVAWRMTHDDAYGPVQIRGLAHDLAPLDEAVLLVGADGRPLEV